MSAIDKFFMPIIYSMALLFRMGRYYSRIVHSVSSFVQKVKMRRGRPPLEATLYADEMEDFFVRNHICYNSQAKKRQNKGQGG